MSSKLRCCNAENRLNRCQLKRGRINRPAVPASQELRFQGMAHQARSQSGPLCCVRVSNRLARLRCLHGRCGVDPRGDPVPEPDRIFFLERTRFQGLARRAQRSVRRAVLPRHLPRSEAQAPEVGRAVLVARARKLPYLPRVNACIGNRPHVRRSRLPDLQAVERQEPSAVFHRAFGGRRVRTGNPVAFHRVERRLP